MADIEKWDDVSQIQTANTKTTLADDLGSGKPVVLRCFDFKANPTAFKKHKPSKQELFNGHLEQIKLMLWGDGLTIMPEVSPRVMISKNKKFYRIYVGAEARAGQNFLEKPKTLIEVANNL